jgi:23S rRNA (cytosine1962-C5)-methyltransferase
VGDAFEVMVAGQQAGERYDLVVVDPPSFASQQAQVPRALAAYRRLARLSLRLVAPGGVLVSASCSARVPAGEFFDTVHGAADAEGIAVQEIARTFHPLDHPVAFAQGAYLKALYSRVR